MLPIKSYTIYIHLYLSLSLSLLIPHEPPMSSHAALQPGAFEVPTMVANSTATCMLGGLGTRFQGLQVQATENLGYSVGVPTLKAMKP